MRPLAELEPTEASRLRGVLFDVDDTVTRNGRLEIAALDALYRLGDAGLLRIAVTGRPLGWAEAIAHQWPVDVAVGENGAGYVRVAAEGTRTGYFFDEEARARARAALATFALRATREIPDIPRSADDASRRCDIAFDVGEHARPSEASIARLITLVEQAGLAWLRSSVHLHVVPGPWDKASGSLLAIERALAEVPDPSAFVFVGDSGNDAAAFARFPLSVGVANVRDHLARLPVPPRYVTMADRGLGFAELTDALLDRRALPLRSRHPA